MKVLFQLGSNRFCASSKQAQQARWWDFLLTVDAGFAVMLRSGKTSLLCVVALLVSALGMDLVEAQAPLEELPAAAVAPRLATQGSGGFDSAIDESLRFGVSARDLYERMEPALVEVLWGGRLSSLHTVGFKAAKGGIYATLIPVGVSKDEGLILRGGGLEREGRVLMVDAGTGLSLIQVRDAATDSLSPLPLRTGAGGSEAGSLVFSINQPGTGEADVCVVGRIAGRDSVYNGVEFPTSYYRVNMHLLRAAAGSPVMDGSGAVIGVLTGRRLQGDSEHHALPVAVLEKLLRDHQRGGRSERAWIGASFHLQSTTPQVMSVREDSPAQRCGLRSGDVVLSVGGVKVTDLSDLVDAFYVANVGKGIELKVLRGVEKLKMKLTPEAVRRKPSSPKGGGASSLRKKTAGGR
ncbi:MAG: S1C family serine protease [Verrucomicrobiales bacterium]|nr:S1C family serine protease [Verrucomicrobiales bacterium]